MLAVAQCRESFRVLIPIPLIRLLGVELFLLLFILVLSFGPRARGLHVVRLLHLGRGDSGGTVWLTAGIESIRPRRRRSLCGLLLEVWHFEVAVTPLREPSRLSLLLIGHVRLFLFDFFQLHF